MKIKEEFKKELITKIDQSVIKFWNIQLGTGGVVRIDSKNNVKAIYLSIRTLGNPLAPEGNEWAKFTPRENEFILDSIYSKSNIYNVEHAHGYRYSGDADARLIATYFDEGEPFPFSGVILPKNGIMWKKGEVIASQLKDGIRTEYIHGGLDLLPDCIRRLSWITADKGEKSDFWTDSDGDNHWSLMELPPFYIEMRVKALKEGVDPLIYHMTNIFNH